MEDPSYVQVSQAMNIYYKYAIALSIYVVGSSLIIDVQFPRPYIIVMNIPSSLGQADIGVGHPVVTIVLETVESSPISRDRQ